MDRWVGRVAVITGASSGIGATIAKDLAGRGVVVVAIARRLDKLNELVATSKGKIYPRQCDVTDECDILSAFRWVECNLGGVDILVNNAGVINFSTLMNGETKMWQKIFDTNVKGLNICTREALKSMRQRGDSGHIFHINSVVGHMVPNMRGLTIGIYTASKHAITALTEALQIELQQARSGIKVTAISPGAVDTEMISSIAGDLRDKGIKLGSEQLKHFLNPQDISDALIYALSTRPHVQVQEILIRPIDESSY